MMLNQQLKLVSWFVPINRVFLDLSTWLRIGRPCDAECDY